MSRVAVSLCLLLCASVAFAQQTNPALREQPTLEDPRFAADQARLNRIHNASAAVLSQRLGHDGPGVCELDGDTVWRLSTSMTEEAYLATFDASPENLRPTVTAMDAIVIEGDCENGDFTAVTNFESRNTSFGTITMQDRRRVTGTLRDGVLDGEIIQSGIQVGDSSAAGLLYRNQSHGIFRYADGELSGHGTTISFSHKNEGLNQITTVTTEVHAPGVYHQTTWMGSMRANEYTTVNGRMHGWMVNHPIEVVRGHRSQLTRTCYQEGRPAGEAACAAESAAPVAASRGFDWPRLRNRADRELLDELERVTQTLLPGTDRAFAEADSVCAIPDDTAYAITYGAFADAYRHRGNIRVGVKVLSGSCTDDGVEGPIEALVRVETRAEGGADGNVIVSRARGEMRGGAQHGRWTSARTTSSANQVDLQSYTIADFDRNALAGPRMTIHGHNLIIERPTRDMLEREAEHYLADFLRERYTTRNAMRHGTSTVFVSDGSRTVRCFQNGMFVNEGRCRGR